jgi:hypothetical protein
VTAETHERADNRSGDCAKPGAGECDSIVDADNLRLFVAPPIGATTYAPVFESWVHMGALKPHCAQESFSHRPKLLARQSNSGIEGERLAFLEEDR